MVLPTAAGGSTAPARTRSFTNATLARSIERTGSVLSALPAGTLQALLVDARRRSWPAGQRVCSGDDAPAALWVVLEGRLGLFHAHESGRELVLETLTAGDVLGETGLAAPSIPIGHDVVAIDDVRAIELSWRAVQLAARLDQELAGLLHAVTIRRLHERGRLATSIAFDAVERRTVHVLLELDRRLGADDATGGRTIRAGLTQAQLATMVGATRKAIVDVLRRLRAEGLVEHERRRLRLLDPAGLRERS